MKHATIIPLIGGMTLANKKITGKDPEVILSYSPFGANDSHITKYLPQVPYKILDDMSDDQRNKIIEILKKTGFNTKLRILGETPNLENLKEVGPCDFG